MRGIVLSAAIAALCLPAFCLPIGAADNAADNKDVNPQEIIQKFASKEAQFRDARNNYTYRQSVKLEELDGAGNPTGGKWELVEDIIFSPDGKRMEKVIYAPVQNLKQIILTP